MSDPFWDTITKSNEFTDERSKIENEMEVVETPEEKEELQRKLDTFIEEYESVPIYSKPLTKDRRHNVIVIGPPRCGKSKLVKKLAYDQKRGAVSLCDLLEWNRSEGNEIVKTVEDYLSEKGEELREIQQTREKSSKKLKTGQKTPPSAQSSSERLSVCFFSISFIFREAKTLILISRRVGCSMSPKSCFSRLRLCFGPVSRSKNVAF